MRLPTREALREGIATIVDRAYPESWITAWLELPLELPRCKQRLDFKVICSDLQRAGARPLSWPPKSRHPEAWARWEPAPETGFWIRPKARDPILRDRLILVPPIHGGAEGRHRAIGRQSLHDACLFAANSGRIVWHNPAKGGASSPDSPHFQSMPVRSEMEASDDYTIPCCRYRHCSEAAPQGFRLLGPDDYPALGVLIWGLVSAAGDTTWRIVRDYDRAQACNLIIEPKDPTRHADRVRVFIFPRARRTANCRVTPALLRHGEEILLHNNRGGAFGEWSFAGVETGLLTQVEWGPLFERMRTRPVQWGAILLRLLRKLTLHQTDEDWLRFRQIIEQHAGS